MGVVKIVSRRPKSKSGLKRTIKYVLRNDQQKLLSSVTGPYVYDGINSKGVYDTFIAEKKIWKKMDGRQCTHSILSWHKDELITSEEALKFARKFAEEHYSGYQTLVVVHEDRGHLHVHMVTNSVSFIDGKMLHETHDDLMQMRQLNDSLCEKFGLVVTEKGKTYEGVDKRDKSTWDMSKHKIIEKGSDIQACFDAIERAASTSKSKSEFISNLKKLGWKVTWSEQRKHIVFFNDEGRKFRDSNLSKTFCRGISKESLEREFEENRGVKKEFEEVLPTLEPVINTISVSNPLPSTVKNSFSKKKLYTEREQLTNDVLYEER